ncbi:hypothetical protein A6U91_07555 [Agrobacterium tumefaciens]|uniref:Uncharacterized protein n=1 Tax=Agrobacterium tumefaciens TaxID=358 RepID=A0AB36EJL2_AGRTU|nr:hypothetical protein A6U91_07555 [Agrobacterium tumefaciens]
MVKTLAGGVYCVAPLATRAPVRFNHPKIRTAFDGDGMADQNGRRAAFAKVIAGSGEIFF